LLIPPVAAGYGQAGRLLVIEKSRTFIITTLPLTVMRWILPVVCLLFLMVILCGCIQSPSVVPPTPEPAAEIVATLPDTTATPHPAMAVTMSAEQTLDSVIIRVDGGNDAKSLTSLNVRITNRDGTTIQRTIPTPVVGNPYTIQYYRIANAATVNIVGTFADGFQQTLLMTSV
jgi:hypothetical protein